MRNMAVLHSPAFSYPLPVLVRVLSNLLIFKGKTLYYNKYTEKGIRINGLKNRKNPPFPALILFISYIKDKSGKRRKRPVLSE